MLLKLRNRRDFWIILTPSNKVDSMGNKVDWRMGMSQSENMVSRVVGKSVLWLFVEAELDLEYLVYMPLSR